MRGRVRDQHPPVDENQVRSCLSPIPIPKPNPNSGDAVAGGTRILKPRRHLKGGKGGRAGRASWAVGVVVGVLGAVGVVGVVGAVAAVTSPSRAIW